MTDLENTGVAGDLTGTDTAHRAATDRARSRSQASGLLIHCSSWSVRRADAKELPYHRHHQREAPLHPHIANTLLEVTEGTEGNGQDSGGHQGTCGPLKMISFPGAAFEREAFWGSTLHLLQATCGPGSTYSAWSPLA